MLRTVKLHSRVAQLPAPCPWPAISGRCTALSPTLSRFAARADCGCTYYIRVQLASADYIVLASFEPPPVTIEQWNDATWTEVRPPLLAPPPSFSMTEAPASQPGQHPPYPPPQSP
jgi:F-box protein 6